MAVEEVALLLGAILSFLHIIEKTLTLKKMWREERAHNKKKKTTKKKPSRKRKKRK